MLTDGRGKNLPFCLASVFSDKEYNLQHDIIKQNKIDLELKSMVEEDLVRAHHMPLREFRNLGQDELDHRAKGLQK